MPTPFSFHGPPDTKTLHNQDGEGLLAQSRTKWGTTPPRSWEELTDSGLCHRSLAASRSI